MAAIKLEVEGMATSGVRETLHEPRPPAPSRNASRLLNSY